MGEIFSSLGSSAAPAAGSTGVSTASAGADSAGASGGSGLLSAGTSLLPSLLSMGKSQTPPPPQAIPLTRTQGMPVAPITVPAVGITGPLGTRLSPAIMALLSRLSPGGMG